MRGRLLSLAILWVWLLTGGCSPGKVTGGDDGDVGPLIVGDTVNSSAGDDDDGPPPWAGVYPAPGLLTEPSSSPECVATRVVDVDSLTALRAALADAQPGDDIRLAAGTYTLDDRVRTAVDGSADQRICVRAANPADRPVLVRGASYGKEVLLIRNPYYVFDGLVMDGDWIDPDLGPTYHSETGERSFRI